MSTADRCLMSWFHRQRRLRLCAETGCDLHQYITNAHSSAVERSSKTMRQYSSQYSTVRAQRGLRSELQSRCERQLTQSLSDHSCRSQCHRLQHLELNDCADGIAVNGVSILNVNSLNNVDPFFPNPTSFGSEGADQCLSHPAGGGEYHYHVASGCMVNPPSGNLSNCSPTINCLNNVGSYSVQMFSSYRTLTVIGIAKDGHVIYGPYTSADVQVTSGFDICNGMFYDSIGNYGYFATSTFPYVTGCFGPGNYSNVKPNCTTNPTDIYTKSSYISSMSGPSSMTGNVSRWMIGYFTLVLIVLNKCVTFR